MEQLEKLDISNTEAAKRRILACSHVRETVLFLNNISGSSIKLACIPIRPHPTGADFANQEVNNFIRSLSNLWGIVMARSAATWPFQN